MGLCIIHKIISKRSWECWIWPTHREFKRKCFVMTLALLCVCCIVYLHQLGREIMTTFCTRQLLLDITVLHNDACCSWLVTSRETFESLTTAWKGSGLQVLYMFSHWKALEARFYSGLISIWRFLLNNWMVLINSKISTRFKLYLLFLEILTKPTSGRKISCHFIREERDARGNFPWQPCITHACSTFLEKEETTGSLP